MTAIETHCLRYGNGMLTVFCDGLPIGEHEFSHRTDRGDDLSLDDNEESELIRLVDAFTSGDSIPWEKPFAVWWYRFITYILRNASIGSDEFKNSRAGLISPDLMSHIREHAGLSLANFREMSLAEVFNEIERIVRRRKSTNTQAGGDHNKKALPENLPEAHQARDAAAEDPPEQHEWHPDYCTVSELADMRKKVKLPCSSSTMTREINKEILAGRIQRDGNKPMRIRLDLHDEWSSKHGE